MSTLLLKHAHVLVTMDSQRQEIADGAVFIRDNVIEAVGTTAVLPQSADQVLDVTGHVVLPGLVNTHHHMFQNLTRVVPGGQNASLFGWLAPLWKMWMALTPDMIFTSALTAMAELLLSGCTTTSDHLYLYPNGSRLDDEISAAGQIGIRFHACRGSLSLGESQGGLPPDSLVEPEEAILRDCRRVIETFHDAARYSMLRIALAPASSFSVTADLMREAAKLARSYGVRLHTHLAETDDDVAFSKSYFGFEPVDYAQELGWIGDDVWHAHCVKLTDRGIDLFARTGTGVAHCPTSNMRLASGIAPIRQMLDAGVHVGLGVDGSASNDTGHMLSEARLAMLLQRVQGNPASLTAREALEMGTCGGAAALGRDDIGYLAPGMAADIIAVNLNRIGFAGAWHDPVAALVFCTPPAVDYSIVNGRFVIRDGQLLTSDLPRLIERHNAYAQQLARS